MSNRIELGTLQMTVEFKDGQVVNGTPRLDFLQDNLKEVQPLVPDGKYQWTLTMDLDSAKKVPIEAEETIGAVIRRGSIPCPRCNRILLVDTKGNVTQCNRCGDAAFVYWNLFVQAV